ncbi:hypothetical protein [Corallococcus sicarius]|uniref:DUF2357 domain-containing protein n=1 Tax=Corallococcus sicarius TaxID=2316726 RepID=A0A3A8NJ52_9BACT|nr:hypothetical protein [Corallococcus sicarius]RKH44288.1 hypothetical protein D7X12_10940 [Corallococcus sicarius]
MRLRSRISGRTWDTAPNPVVPDLFEVLDRPGAPSSRLVPEGVEGAEEKSFLGQWPESIDLHSLERLAEPLRDGVPWSTWVNTLPLVPQIDKKAQLHPLEREAIAQLPHLQHVCHRPRLHLRVDEERLAVSRARRVSSRATATLVSHPGDWEHRTLRGIQPARILATQIEDDWNLYENRVAVCLVDHLLAWVGQRREELSRIKSMAEESGDFGEEALGSRWRGQRLFALWGKYSSDNALMQELLRALQLVERLERDLQALLDSPLYQELPRTRSVPVALQPTNILVNDPHYRKVAALWRAWARYGHVPHPSREEVRRQRQAACRDFGAFARLIVVRALSDLGYQPPAGTLLAASAVVELSGPRGTARLECAEGGMTLECEKARLRFVPLLVPLTRDGSGSLWQQVREHAASSLNTVVLALGRPQEGDTAETTRAISGWEWPRLLPISPWSLDAVERVTRVIHGWEAATRLAGYPPRAVVRPDPGVSLPKWMQRVGDSVAIVAPANATEQQRLLAECARRGGELEREQQQARNARRPFDPGRLSALDQLKKLLPLAARMESCLRCPVCETAPGSFEPRPAGNEDWDQWSWWCRCKRCESEWGLRVCGECRAAYPVLEPGGCQGPATGERRAAGWVDRHYGRDLWAEPCGGSESPDAFRCSHCGRCPERGCSHCLGRLLQPPA